ncbi:MAG: sigma-70 family RNA polymerase sigma factor [Anaerolineales bacterium]|nr:sigma-70 family RNA polymerase sigma factor [Anaerolineales bacterium]
MIVLVLPDIPVEDELLAKARRGDQEAIMHIYDSYFQPIYQFVRLRVGDSSLAEDIASEVFLKFVDSLGKPSAPRKTLRGWLFRVARHEIHHHYKKSAKLPTTTLDEWLPDSGDESDPEVQFIQTLNVERARHALRMLAPDQQEVLVLRFGQQLDLQETADVMGKTISAIKSLQFRAVNTLREILGEMRPSHG